LISTL